MEEYYGDRPKYKQSKPEQWIRSGIGSLSNWKERHFGENRTPMPESYTNKNWFGREWEDTKNLGKFAKNEAKFLAEMFKDAAYTTYGAGAHSLGGSKLWKDTAVGDWLMERGPGQGLGDAETIYKTTKYIPKGMAEFINDYVPGAKLEELGHKTGMYKNPYYDEEFSKPFMKELKNSNSFYFGDNVWESKGFREWQKATGNSDDKFNQSFSNAVTRWVADNPYHNWLTSSIANPGQYSDDELWNKYNITAGAIGDEAVQGLSDEYLKYADGRVDTEVGNKTGVNVKGYHNLLKYGETQDPKDLEGVDLGVFQNWLETPDIMKPDEDYSNQWAQQFYTDPITKFMGEIPTWALGSGILKSGLKAPKYLAQGTKFAPVASAISSGIGNLFPAMTLAGTSIPKWVPRNQLLRWGVAPFYNVPRAGVNVARTTGLQFGVPIGMEAYRGHQD